jgi:Predicted AAA-ATPase/PD-(D/E)XK nuclease superfamily
MIKIPYGESDFKKLVVNDLFYQDRTQFIPMLEDWASKYQVFLRPRRFGKSLFISILQHYYGVEYASDFQFLFGKYYVGKHPTKEANQYYVLRFEYSRIDTKTHESTYAGFFKNTLLGVRNFLAIYDHLFTKTEKQEIVREKTPEDLIKTLFSFMLIKGIKRKIYLLIDEYDHFANELLSFDMERFKLDVSRNGFVRKFYETLKHATAEGVLGRIFITGVSPVTLDSLTSGFNISDNMSTNARFHELMGFTAPEVIAMLQQCNIAEEKLPALMHDLTDWYDGYRFSIRSNEHLFNPDMVLYFLKEYTADGRYPIPMLDTNIVSDYRKIKNIFKIGGEELSRFEIIDELVKNGYIDFELTFLYNLESNFTEEDFLSLLFYLGMLRVKEEGGSSWRFEIPNYVIKKLYFEYFTSIFLEKTKFANTNRPITKAIDYMMQERNPDPFFKVVEHVLSENHSNRDSLVYGEKHLQTLMIGLLFPYKSFFIHSEYESQRQYPDIFLERVYGRPLKYEVVLELKYVKKIDADTLPDVIQQAENQLNSYMITERFSRPNVCGFYVIFLGSKVHQWGEWGHY